WIADGEKEFLAFRSHDTQAGRIDVQRAEDELWEDRIMVKTVWLGNYLQTSVDFLKLDIEGAELPVLESCAHLLKNVQQLMVEVHYRVHNPDDLIRIMSILKDSGYNIA